MPPRAEARDRLEIGSGPEVNLSYAKFSIQPETGALSIKIVDARTDEVIREIPPERVLAIAQELQALARRSAGHRPADHLPYQSGGTAVGDGVDRYG